MISWTYWKIHGIYLTHILFGLHFDLSKTVWRTLVIAMHFLSFKGTTHVYSLIKIKLFYYMYSLSAYQLCLQPFHKVCMQVGGGGSHGKSVHVSTERERGEFKHIEYRDISTVFFPIFEDILNKKRKMKMVKVMEVSLMIHLNS